MVLFRRPEYHAQGCGSILGVLWTRLWTRWGPVLGPVGHQHVGQRVGKGRRIRRFYEEFDKKIFLYFLIGHLISTYTDFYAPTTSFSVLTVVLGKWAVSGPIPQFRARPLPHL